MRGIDEQFEICLINHCAPTLAAVKPASLFPYHWKSQDLMHRTVTYWAKLLMTCGLSLRILKNCKKSQTTLIYIFRKCHVSKMIAQKESLTILREAGYFVEQSLDTLLVHLSRRMCLEEEFPHEIGLFLGYPVYDVIGFIENKGKNYSCCGCWKSYSDPREAQAMFVGLKRCTSLFRENHAAGMPLTQMIVAGSE